MTGAKGFIGRNLIAELANKGYTDIFEYDIDSDLSAIDEFCKKADFVFHLAGVNRPLDQSEFMQGNFGFTTTLLNALKKHDNYCPVMLSSSIQAELDNPYGASKKAGEDLLFSYGEETGAHVLVYRFPNVFGKWSRPNYNSAIATFCYNIAREIPITIDNPETILNLAYIDDVIEELINALGGHENSKELYCEVPVKYTKSLGEIVSLLRSFKQSREDLQIPKLSDPFAKKLFSTYISFLPEGEFNHGLHKHIDKRGLFAEILKTPDRGQVSINISKPGVTKGNHWHHTKVEKFVVVHGEGVIRFRKIGSDDVLEYHVNSESLEIVDIPPGYTHSIENRGETNMVTVIWANELFDPEHPDTFYLEV